MVMILHEARKRGPTGANLEVGVLKAPYYFYDEYIDATMQTRCSSDVSLFYQVLESAWG